MQSNTENRSGRLGSLSSQVVEYRQRSPRLRASYAGFRDPLSPCPLPGICWRRRHPSCSRLLPTLPPPPQASPAASAWLTQRPPPRSPGGSAEPLTESHRHPCFPRPTRAVAEVELGFKLLPECRNPAGRRLRASSAQARGPGHRREPRRHRRSGCSAQSPFDSTASHPYRYPVPYNNMSLRTAILQTPDPYRYPVPYGVKLMVPCDQGRAERHSAGTGTGTRYGSADLSAAYVQTNPEIWLN